MEIKSVKLENPDGLNLILGQSHFIKTVEDLYEILVSSIPGIQFGLAFCEASGPCLIRHTGTNEDLRQLAIRNAKAIGAGHSFIIFLKDAFPINILNAVKHCQEVAGIFCATANTVEVIVAESKMGRGILGVVDGQSPKEIETDEDIQKRKDFLRKIGYKN